LLASGVIPTANPATTLGFLGRRSVLFDGFLFMDKLVGPVPFVGMPPSSFYHATAYSLIKAILLPSSISASRRMERKS